MINCHTHIFYDEHVPENFLPAIAKPLVNLLENGKVTARLEERCRQLGLDGFASQVARFHSFAVHSASKPEYRTLDTHLLPFYPAGTRFVVLSMDMEYMEAGKPRRSYINQLDSLTQLTKMQKYKNVLHPFVAADPRRPDVFKLVKKKIEREGFWGIKIYPALGFFPFDSRLNDMYQWAEDNQVPIMTHTSRGGVFYRGNIHNVHPLTNAIIPGRNKNQLSEGFTDPDNYKYVLERYYDLKICLAHYGGQSEWVKKLNNPNLRTWPDAINELLRNPKYPNVYTDISFTLYDTVNCLPLLRTFLQHPKQRARILYGTDFYMTIQEATEDAFLTGVRDGLPAADWEAISVANNLNYLNSTIRKVNLP